MSDQGKKPNLRDLTSRLGQIQQRVVTIDPASPNSTPENTGEVRRYVKIDVSEGNNAKACDNVPEGNVSATYGVQESTENEEGDGSTIKEFVHEVEFQHNTLLGKMQMLRDVLAKQLNQSQVQSSLNEAQKDANQSQAEQTQSQLGAVQTPDLQDQSEVVQNMSQTDEREDIQKKTFAKWINSQLVKGQHAPVTDLFYDLRDGTRLLALLEVLTNKTFKREKGRMRVHHLNNVSRALAILEDNNVKLVNISNEHIVDGSAKLTLGLVWAIILHWQVQGVLKDVMSDLQQTNLEKTLLAWCRQTTKGYHGVDVQNFTTSWTDGLAFNALIHSHRPHLFDWTVLARKHPYARLENAFRVAHEHLSIERLLDPEDVNSQVPDKKSIMMYVMCLFQALPHASFTMESLDLSVQSDSSFSVEASSDDVPMSTKKNRPLSNVSIGLGEYQHTLEEVLTWLLGAEDRLAAMPPIAESTDEVKDQFHDLEELMLELTSKQGGIGDVLGEGSRLLREGVMEEEEEEEVRVQMKLLNTRWEELRVKAMDRQSKLHEKLMALQQNQLDSLKRWLTETEDRIANMSQVGPTLEALEEQIAAHQSLQADLEKEQSNINSLSNMVVVVDESSSDAAYSSLEDELNALGERWAHICKWTESRWNMLQNLSVYWKALDQGMVKMRQWMDEKETLLRQVESNPSTEQEHILQQASMLQVLQAELEVQQRCLGHLQEHSANVASHLPSDSDIQEKMSVELENIQDRMDILVSIIEAQTQRLAASGIDITKVVIPGKDSTDVVSSSTTTISSEGGTVVTKIITTKVVTTETVEVEGSGIKRQKLEGGCQEDFSVALHQLGGWMDMIEEKTKPRPVEELTLEQLMQLVQQLESEMETQKEEYYKVVSLGQSAISETSTIGESSQESEKQVAGITTRWEALIEMLVEIRTRVTYLTQKKKISTDLSDLEVHYQEFLRWCDDMQTISENEPNAIKLHLEQCQSKLNAMKNREEELKCIMKAAESLDGKWTQETHILIEEIKIIITKWEVLVQRLFERRKTLTQKVEEVQSASVTPKALAVPPESLLKAIEASREWLCSLETAIASECVVAPLPQMQDVFEKFKDLSQKVDTEQGNMAYINDACNSVSKDSHPEVLESVSKLNNQWELTTSDLKSRIKTIEKLIERQKQYNDEVTGLKSWLAEVDIFLQAEEAALGDIETLEAQLEQSNALQDDIATLQNNFNNISTTGKQLLEEGNEELKTMVKSQLEELTARWDTVTEQARVQNKSLKEALAKSQKVHEDIEKLSTWLDDVEKRIPSSLTTDKEEELNSGIETFSQLRDEISKHSEDFRALNNIGDEMLQLDAAATHEELARQFTQLNGRWTEVVSQVDSKYKTLTTAAQQYEDFKKYCAEEKDWLDQLQAGLEKSTKSAADAEEISEALDELEIFLHSHNEERLEQIRKLAESLVSENVMADSVQEITQSLTTRFETLNAQATEQQSGLEGRVQEAQAWEREYISVLDYLAQSDLLLTQAIADPTLQVDPVQVQSELAVQQEVLKKMQKQVEVYHSQGKTEAAVRLEDQVTHLLKKYEEIEMKLRLVQKPSDFDERLENVSKQLKDIHEKVHLTSIGSGNPDVIQEQLNQCMSIYQLLSEIKAEVENVIATGRKIVKDGQSTDPDGLTQQLDQLKALYNQLGGAVTEQRGTLERTLRHSRKVQKDAGHLEEWLTTTESELDQREATVPTKCIQAELHFAQHAIDDLGRKKPLLTGLHESYAALTSVCDDSTVLQPVKEQVDDIALTWERVSTRLTNRLKNMQSEQVSKEADMEKFIVGLGEIKGWLESTEHQLGNLGKMEPNDQAKLVKAVASEVQNYKSHIENIRDTAVDLINHGTLFQARVQPELVQINQRWENIFKTVQQSSQDTQDTVGDILVLETHEPKPSAGLTNTTTSLSTITDFSSVKETAFLTSLTSDSSQLDQTSGMLERAAEVHLSSQVKEKEEKEQFQVQESHAISRDAESSSTNLVGEQGLLKSIDLVRSVMSTTTTYTTSTTSSSKLFQEPSLDSNNHIQYKEGIQLEETVSADMGSSADSSLWGDSPMVDSVIKVEKKAKSEVLDPSATKDTENSLKACEESTSKQDSQMPDTSEDKNSVNIIEVEEVKMTISHLAFNIPSSSSEEKISSLTKCNRLSSGVADTSSLDSSSRDVSPVPEYPPDESSLKERKRKITESETDLDNFDDLIAGLKEVAEKDIDLTAIEKARRRNSEKEMDLDQGGDERFSLLKIRRRDDDDLESLASVDTDMAPASETSRDFEATFSDLESVSESVSSRGDSLFSPSVTQGCNSLSTSKLEEVRTVEHISQRAQIVTSESVTHPFLSNAKQLSSKVENDTNLFVKLGDEDQHKVMETDVSDNLLANTSGKLEVCNVEVNKVGKDYEQLPVEKLQAMIAELEEVMSDTELSDSDSETKNAVKESSDHEAISSMKDSNKAENLSIDDIVMKDTDSEALPIEFKIQEVHVGDIEFAQAKGSYERSHTTPLEMPFKVLVTSTPVLDDSVNQNKENASEHSNKEEMREKKSVSIKEEQSDSKEQGSVQSVQKVSVHSSQVVHGMTLVSSTENRLPEAEEAVLVTLISRSSSAEAIATDSESTESKNNLIMEQVREENADTDDDIPDFERKTSGNVMKHDEEKLKKGGNQNQHDSNSDKNKIAITPASSSSSSSSDDDTKKTRRPTVIECPAFTVGLDEELTRTDEKVKCEECDGSLNYVSLKEADAEVSHDKVNTGKVLQGKEQAIIPNVKETGTASCIIIGSDVGIKKRKRFAKIYEEGDGTILTEMTKGDDIQKRLDSEEKKAHSAHQPFESKSSHGAIAKETLITPDSIEKALLRKGVMERREVCENWELSSSSSSISQSKRESSTEGSIDFGSETRGTLSGDWDDAPVITDVNTAEEMHKIQEGNMEVIDELEESEDVRFSFLSSNSIDTDRDEIFTNEMESETPMEGEGIDSSSSDESDSAGEPSTTRISAATIYEQAVIQALEGSDESKLVKKDDQEGSSIVGNETCLLKAAVEIREAERDSSFLPERKSGDLQTGMDSQDDANAKVMSAQDTQNVKDTTVSKSTFKGTASSPVLPQKDDVVEIVYEVVTVTRSKVVAVPEMATILHLPDESDLSEETDVSEEQKGGLVPLEVKEQTFEVVAPEQCSAHDEGQKGTRLISSSLVGKNKDSSLADKSGSAKSKEGENLPCPTQHRKADEVKGKQSNIDHTCDQEQLTVSHTDTSYPLGKPQYSGSVQEEKKMFEKTAESSVGPSLITDVICVDVTDETKEASANFEIAGNFKGHKISHRTESKYHSGNIDDEKNSSLEGLLPLPHEKTDEEVNKKMYQTEDQKETSQPARSVSRAHENTKKLGIANIDETHKVSTDVEALKKENCRKLSVTSSSSSSSSFEMVDNEMEVDLEDQLSSHESYCEPRNEGKENISGNGSESDEGLDTLEEPDTFELQKGLGPTCIPLDVKLERHVSIDSSVSTLSEAETVIHVPIESLSQADTETTSVKDDSQIGVKAVKRGDVNESLIRSVSEELITKTSDSENELLSRDELADDKEAVLKENPLQIGIDNKGVTAVVAKTDAASSEDYVIITKEKSLKGEVDQAFVCATISPIEDDISPDNEDSDSSPFEILDRQTVNKRYVVYDSSKSKPSPSKLLISNIPHQSESSRQPALKKVEKSVKHEESLDSMSIGKSDVAYPGLDMESTVNTSVTVGDIGQHISDTDDGDGWINIGVLAQTKSREKQVSVDVAQVIQRTEVSEEQEVSISIPDTHLEDSKGESSASSDDEIDYKVSEITKRKSLEEELSDFLIDSKHSAGKTKEFETAAENRRALTEPLKDPGSNDTKESLEGKTKKPNSLCLLDSTFEDDGKPKTVCDNKLNKENDQEEEMTFSKCVLKDTDYVVVDDCAELKVEEHKLNKGKESSSSCDTSNSTGSSPYYDASGEMVESLGSDEVSSSMEVLHSSAEILDMPMASWTSSVDFESPNHEELNEVCDHGPAPPRETKKSRSLWNEQEHTAPSRFSTISACTDASEEVIFSETEGEELPYEDTTDDDLTLEEEAIKELAEKHKEALPSTTQAFQTVTTSETVFAMRSYVKETTKKQSEAGKDDDEGYLAEVSRLAEKIGELRNKTKVTPSYEEALEKAEALEHEVAELEPDIATIISRGDTLTLTTHMVDVHKANVIRTAVNDLRNHWSALKSETEGVKANAEKVNEEVNAVSKKADDIVNWINDVSKRLHLVNNDESQLQALEKEMAKKKEELDDLNNSGALLKKYRYNHIQPILTLLNTRWTEINMQFRQYRKVSLEKKTIVSSSKVEAEVESTNVPDFVASVNRLREAISAISRQLSANKLAGNHYDNLKGQEDELKSIKGGIETLKPRVDGLEEERNATIKNVSPVQSEQVRRVMDKLREEWAQVNRGYTERHSHWLQCSENWRTLQKTIEEFSVWLTSIEEKVQTTASQSLPEAKITQKELEKQVTLKHRPSQTLQSTCKEITDAINPEEGKRLQERVDSLMKRWRSLLLDLAARREKIAGEEGSKEGSNVEYEALVTWVDQAQALMDAPVNVTDEASLSAHTTMVQNHLIEITTKQNLLKKLKDSKSKTLTPSQITLLETNMSKVVKSLPDYKNMMDTKLGVIKTLVTDVEDLYKWTEEMRVKTALHNLSEEEVKMMKITLHEKEVLYENLDSTYWVLAQDAESKGLTVAVGLKNRMNTIESRLKALQGQVLDASDRGKSTSPATSPAFSRITPAPARGTEKADEEKVVQEKQKVEVMKEAQQKTPEIKKTEMRPVSTGTTVTSSVTNVIQNVIKFEESVLSTEGDLRPPSPLVCPPKHSSDSSPALILASLDKSILQIRDWLTLMEQMTRQQTVVVGDAENIRQLTEKQKSVLRELEGKKPQLDELVASADSLKDDASRTQLHQKAAEGDAAVYKFPTHSRLFDHLRTCFKVSKLREHWDETNSVVLARKTQLDAMYGDTHKFDAKRSELESWLSRMEARLERMAPVAHTADVLDQQIREQKGFHAEIHQYKHQVELFNQMTQRLIAIYQHDDTRKLKKITETINLRYSSLNSSIIARGKALHSAMNSLHNFDKALDKFASWMSDAESNTDLIELEVDKLGPARRDPQARGPAIRLKLAHYSSYDQLQYKDLQSEIESHKDVLASLNATGQKLLGTLENQDEAVMLQRRLEEMNQRWNTLKHKSIAIRNRLEGNAENWNTLLLSLRELIEWVIRKDTELTALGPLVGDLNSLSKFSEDLAAFRRVIDEKQPVIESNLKSGRQLIASEPPLSDTSDSEAGRELDGDARYRGDDSARDLTRSVRREVAKLSEKWAALRERAAAAAAQADLAHKKLGVLQKTVEEVSGRLDEAQKTADGWGPISQDPNLADQHAHNVRKFREGLAELQRGVDDVNDQAARFSAHNVPLTPANSAKLHDLNNRWKNLETAVNDRWRQVASRSREVTPLTPAQLASSVSPPWERATTSNKVPYYINHDQESTHWDHPIMMDLLDSMNEFNHIKFSAYRTATKLRMLQKKLSLDLAKLQMATDVFDEHGLRGQNDRLIDVGDMVVVLSALYANISADHPEVNTTLAIDLCLNWLLNVYDSQRTGQMRVLSFKIGLVCLCCGHLEEKYRYMFRLIADPNRLVDQRKLGLLLHDCVQVPRQLGEVAAFGGSNIEPSVRSCFTKAGKDRETIEAVHFLAWVQQEPQSLVWLAVLHRVAASENIQHQVKCNICKAYPIVGLRYRCLKCLSFDMCQRCFFDGRSGKSHKITHPMHEYCTATTAGEDVKDFTKALKNKFKSKRSLQKHTKKGYLPVQTVLEGDPLESPSPSPQHNVTSQDMHSRLELYASRLAEVELRTNSNSTPDSEDEHGLIAQYCQSLSSSDAPLPVPRSPLQIMAAVDADQKDELEQMIRALEEENSVLQAEYDRLKSQQTVGSPPDDGLAGQRSEADMLAEAKLLRQHKGRLEARMGILEEHNRQLEAQLHRLRQLLGEPGVSSPNKSGTLQTKSVTASQLAMDSPAKVNGHSTQGGATSAYEGLEQMSEYVRPPPPPMGSVAHVGNLFSRAGDLGKAVGTLVATMTHEGASDLPSDEEEDPNASDTEEEKAV
ncbi:dystrophin-like isoform X4 [Macrobrachium rosenbergii]|uniref:dystrophin-like isoform X4 n=1 Tax=Macrobrachium rosenbergii TaxID=79674 RepID=UPI0034D6D6C7